MGLLDRLWRKLAPQPSVSSERLQLHTEEPGISEAERRRILSEIQYPLLQNHLYYQVLYVIALKEAEARMRGTSEFMEEPFRVLKEAEARMRGTSASPGPPNARDPDPWTKLARGDQLTETDFVALRVRAVPEFMEKPFEEPFLVAAGITKADVLAAIVSFRQKHGLAFDLEAEALGGHSWNQGR